jgi:AcrR family transcriptional regulator
VGIKAPIKITRKRVTKPPVERRQDLMDAAVRVFAEKGIARTTVSDITVSAGVAKGTFYLYFDSKEALLAALKERFVNELLAHATALYERVGREEWWTLVDQTVEDFVDLTLKNKDLIHVLVQEGITPETSEVFAECQRRIDAMFVGGIQAGIAAEVFKVSDPELAARMIHHALEGSINHAVLYEPRIERDRLITAAREFVHKILAP